MHYHARKNDIESIYGTVLSFWDRLFDSGSHIDRRCDMPIGVEGAERRDC